MSNPLYVASGTEASGIGALNPALPSGWTAGNLFLLHVATANEAVSAPSGWTALDNSPQSTGTAGATGAIRLSVFRRIAQSGDTAPTVADSGNHQYAWISEYSGCDATTPVLITAGSVLSSAGTTGTATGFTTTAANCLIVGVCAIAVDTVNTLDCAVANAGLTSVTKRRVSNTSAGNGSGLCEMTGVRASAGAIGSTTFEWSDVDDGQPISDVQAMLMIALQPTVAAPTQVWAVANGNSNSGATWNGGVVPTSSQDVFANGFTVTVNASTHWKSARTTAGTTAVAGGGFTLSNGVTLTLDNGNGSAIAGSTTCLTYQGTAGNSATLIGHPVGSATNIAAHGLNVSSTGTMNVTGNPTGGAAGGAIGLVWSNAIVNVTGTPIPGAGPQSEGIRCQGTGTLNLTGSPTGGSTVSAVRFTAAGNGTITGTVTGGTGSGGYGLSTTTATVIVNGPVIGGSGANAVGVNHAGAGTVTINDNVTGGTNVTAYGASNTSTGTLIVNGKAISATAPGVNGAVGAALTSVVAAETGVECINPLNGKVVFANLSTATYGVRNAAGTLKTLTAGGSSSASPFGSKVFA